MRLIDKDDLIITILKNDLVNKKCGSDIAILNAPIIEAIPIEWLINKCNEADDLGMGIDDWSVRDCYQLVLDDWRKENVE